MRSLRRAKIPVFTGLNADLWPVNLRSLSLYGKVSPSFDRLKGLEPSMMQHIRHRHDVHADELESVYGTCPQGRQALLTWLCEQNDLAEHINASPTVFFGMIEIRYERWVLTGNHGGSRSVKPDAWPE